MLRRGGRSAAVAFARHRRCVGAATAHPFTALSRVSCGRESRSSNSAGARLAAQLRLLGATTTPKDDVSPLHAAYLQCVSDGSLEENASQGKVIDYLAKALELAGDVASDRRTAAGREFWAWPTKTLGTTSSGGAEDRDRVAAYTAQLAAANRQKVRNQARRQRQVGQVPNGKEAASAASVSSSSSSAPAAADGSVPIARELTAGAGAETTQHRESEPSPPPRPVRRSVYLHGSVGTGKTMLLNLFHVAAQGNGLRVRRQHFYEFMVNLHEQIHETTEERPVEVVANTLADDVDALCFDEFQITDIQDASILPRLFEVLFLRGVTVVMTSNTAPPLLYSGGLNRHVYLPAFIGLLGDYCTVLGLGTARSKAVDYRRKAEELELQKVKMRPSSDELAEAYMYGEDAEVRLMKRWGEHLAGCGAAASEPRILALPMGRKLQVAKTAGNACLLNFEELCGSDRGEAEFLVIAEKFKLVFLTGVPRFMSLEDSDAIRRFVKLLDVLYDRRVRLLLAAAAVPAELFDGVRAEVSKGDMGDLQWRTALYSADGRVGMNSSAVGTLCEAIRATERAESRLREMRTQRYWDACDVASP